MIRSATIEDAQSVLTLGRSVLEEEIYQLTSASEFKMTKEDEEKWIAANEVDPNKLILVAEVDSSIFGILDFSNGRRRRISHTGEFGMSVDKGSREQGRQRRLRFNLMRVKELNMKTATCKKCKKKRVSYGFVSISNGDGKAGKEMCPFCFCRSMAELSGIELPDPFDFDPIDLRMRSANFTLFILFRVFGAEFLWRRWNYWRTMTSVIDFLRLKRQELRFLLSVVPCWRR